MGPDNHVRKLRYAQTTLLQAQELHVHG
jgi:hypothetical protein